MCVALTLLPSADVGCENCERREKEPRGIVSKWVLLEFGGLSTGVACKLVFPPRDSGAPAWSRNAKADVRGRARVRGDDGVAMELEFVASDVYVGWGVMLGVSTPIVEGAGQ